MAPPRAVIVPATDKVDPPAVSVMAPALPPLLSLAVAAWPDEMIVPTRRDPLAPVCIDVSVTAPPDMPGVVLRVSIVALVESIDGAAIETAAPPDIIPTGFTVPIVSAERVVNTTDPVASDAKTDTTLSGFEKVSARLSVKLPVPLRPSLAD